jgi:DNA (cytosine-5)-methyltransferase 1
LLSGSGGGRSDDLNTPLTVARPVTATAHKNHDTDTDTLVHSLTSEGHDASEDGTGRGTSLVVTPIDLRNATRSDPSTGEGTPGTGVGEEGDPSFPVSTMGAPPAVAFRKAQKAHDAADNERWEQDELAATVDASGHGPRTAEVVVFSVYPEGGQGADLMASQTDVAPSVGAVDNERQSDRGTRIVDEQAVRRLMPVECERLQGFPDGWTDLGGTSDSTRYRQLGNAVCVNVAEWIARRLAQA